MARITRQQRTKLKTSQFGLPQKARTAKGKATPGSYPIDSPGRARAALAYSKRFASPAQQSQIRARVTRKYPSMKVSKPVAKRSRSRRG